MTAALSPVFSVVIPTYDRERVLGGTLFSVLSQSFRGFEVIIVDDNSKDGTEARVRSLRAEAQAASIDLRYIRLGHNRGANHARNLGIQAATGKYVAFLDSDDFWHPRKLEFQFERIREFGTERPVLCFTDRYRVNGDFELIAYQRGPDLKDPRLELRRGNSIGTLSSVVMDRVSAQAIGGFDEQLRACQDWDVYLKAAERCGFLRVGIPLTIYVDGSAGRISLDSRRRARAHLQIYRRHLRGEEKPGLAELYRNLAEDMAKMGRTGIARKLYLAHLAAKERWLRALLVKTGITQMPDLVSRRQALYGRRSVPNHTLPGSQIPILDEYRRLFETVAARTKNAATEAV